MSHEAFTLGHSPDPDDAFMFYAMAEEKIDLRGYRFDHILQDIQTLNERAMRGELHISAISIHAYAYAAERYALLPSGASMGDGYGPIVVVAAGTSTPAGHNPNAIRQWLAGRTIVSPGPLTSSELALRLFLSETDAAPPRIVHAPFDRIFETVRDGRADAGIVIHEGQLTYGAEGFEALVDLGIWWGSETGGLPLPLGGNVVRKDIPPNVRSLISAILSESVAYGLANRDAGVAHSMPLARGLDRELTDRFIGMYVNDLTRDYGDRGRTAISEMMRRAAAAKLIPAAVTPEFVV